MTAFTRLSTTSVSLLALLSAPALADPVTAPEIVVTPARAPVPLHDVASSMTVITSEDIQRQNKTEVVDVLRDVPGITVDANGENGQTARVFMRGTNSNHVLVMIDGVVVNDPSDPGDAYDFANIATDNIERIEVLRGAQSTLYGSQAIGGVINIITKQGRGAPKYNAYAEYGRYNTSREGAGVSGEAGRTSYSFAAGNAHTSGLSALDKKFGGFERDASDRYNVSGNVASKLTDNFTAKLNARYSRVNTEFDSPGGFSRPADDPDPVNDTRQITGRAAGELSLYDGKWTQELGVSFLDFDRDIVTEYFDPFFTPLFGRTLQVGKRETVDWVHHIKILPDHVLTVGSEFWTESFKTLTLSEVNVDNKAVFADDQFNIGKNFFMNVGVREDDHQAFGDQFTWKIAPGYRIAATGTTLKATYGTAFKAPSLSQLYDPSFGNPALNPEKSKGWDAGFEQPLFGDTLTISATAFRNDIRQLISNNPSPPFAAINLGKARTEGIESGFTLRPTLDWTITGNYTYTLAEDRANNVELLRRPKHQASAGVTYQVNTLWDVGANGRYFSSRRDIDFQSPFGRVFVKSFATFDLFTNYKVTDQVTLYGRLDNLLDKRYEEVYAYGQPGRAVTVGAKAAF